MKIETKKQEFQPVVITLVSQEEVDQLFALAGHFGFGQVDYDITVDLHTGLTPVSQYCFISGEMEFCKL